MKIIPQQGLVKFSILPVDFKFEITWDEEGRAVTQPMGLSRFTDFRMGYSANWYNQLTGELIIAFSQHFKIRPEDVNILSRSDPDGALVCWLRSRFPVRQHEVIDTKTKKPLALSDDNPIELEVMEVNDLPQLESKQIRIPRRLTS